jgi:MFS family permease
VVNLVLGAMAVAGVVELWLAFLLIFIAAAMSSIDVPVRQALIPELVPQREIPNAVALATGAQMGTFALSPALAGFVIEGLGAGGAYLVSVAGNAGVIAALTMLRYRGRSTEARRHSVLDNVREGARYVRGDPLVLRVILVMLTMGALGLAVFNGLIAKWASEVLHLEPGGYGLLASMWGTGTLVTAYWLASTGALSHKGRIFTLSSIGFGVTFAAFGLARWLPLVGVVYFLNGVAMAGANVTSVAIVQSVVSDAVRGRVMSLYALNQSAAQLNGITLGAAAQVVGVEVLVPAATVLCTAIVAGLVLTSVNLRRLDARAAVPEVAEVAGSP